MPRGNYPRTFPSKYAPLAAYIAAQEGDYVLLSFTEIEAIIGVPLSVSAQVSDSFWTSLRGRLVRDLTVIGWQAHLRVRDHAVEFWRLRITPGGEQGVRSE